GSAGLGLTSYQSPPARLEIIADVLPPARSSPSSAVRRFGSTPLAETTVDDHFRALARKHPPQTLDASPFLAGHDHEEPAGGGCPSGPSISATRVTRRMRATIARIRSMASSISMTR